MADDNDLRVAVIGTGLMGADHAKRLGSRISGARLTVVADVDLAKAEAVAAEVPGSRALSAPLEAVRADDVDAVLIASPGFTHEELVLAALEAGKPVLCEKPLTLDAESSLRVVEAEAATGRQSVQVGFMRRFDPEYVKLKHLLDSGELGRALLVHNAHRNAAVPDAVVSEGLVVDSVVHEIDTMRWLLGEEITAISVLKPPATRNAAAHLQDPQLVIMESAGGTLIDVEIFVNWTVGYQVRCEVSGEKGSALIGSNIDVVRHTAGQWGGVVPQDFRDRFGLAYDIEVQRWVDAARRGTIDGPGTWDGYAAAVVCEAGVKALQTGERVEVNLAALQTVH